MKTSATVNHHARLLDEARERHHDAQVALKVASNILRDAVIAARQDGLTLQQIADVLGVTRQRVHELTR